MSIILCDNNFLYQIIIIQNVKVNELMKKHVNVHEVNGD